MSAAPGAKPFSAACARNQAHIGDVLEGLLGGVARVLEIGSGTGQHAVYFGRRFPDLVWQPSDLTAHHAGIAAWLAEADLPNVPPPLALDVLAAWPEPLDADAIFTANTLHIMSWPAVRATFALADRVLAPASPFVVYGPFSYAGRHTAPSNARFDRDLRTADPAMGIRDLADLTPLAADHGLRLDEDVAMPANNRVLVFRKGEGTGVQEAP